MGKTIDEYGNYITNWNYREIILLDRLLTQNNIPHYFEKMLDGWHILYPSKAKNVISVIEHYDSYGHEKDLLEIMGLLTPEEREIDSVTGHLTAENVYKRIRSHYNSLNKE